MLLRSKKFLLGLLILIILAIFAYLNYAFNFLNKPAERGQIVNLLSSPDKNLNQSQKSVDYKIVEFTRGLYVPWSIVFTSKSRMLVSERNGNIREIKDGSLTQKPLIELKETVEVGESGLMGLSIHPNYSFNKYVYACLTYVVDGKMVNKIERFVDKGDNLARDKIILDGIPSARFHAGCRIGFGPDEKLYVTVGDASVREEAQNLNSLAGKILRINDDGSIPSDNPFGTLIWSYGHRNPQGIAWQPESGILFSTEHGPSGSDGPGGGDEINIIKKGFNYGWPIVSHEKSRDGLEKPKLIFTPAEAPSGASFYGGDVFPQFKNNFFFTALRGEGLFRVILGEDNPEEIIGYEKIKEVNFGRIRDVLEGPDGLIYFVTSNRDGRGKPREGDDKIYRFEPIW